MPSITLSQAQQILQCLIESETTNPAGNFSSVAIGGRVVTYRSFEDRRAQINYWATMIARLQRSAAGAQRNGPSVASFR